MSLATAILLGVVQGLTEWLPVSSSGHLVLFEHLSQGGPPPVAFDVALHLGTLVVVVAFFRKEINLVIRACTKALIRTAQGHSLGAMMARDPYLRLGLVVVVGTFPTVVLGLGIERYLTDQVRTLPSVGLALMVTGGWLLVARRPAETRSAEGLTLKDGLLVGLAQGIAIIPGISRSGSTIATGLLVGLEGEAAARLSFLLFIPAVIGAAVLSLMEAGPLEAEVGYVALAAGTLTAMIVGAVALKLLLVLIHRRVLHHFAPYCLGLGATVLAWTLFF